MHGPLWRNGARFSSSFIFHFLGTHGRRLTLHNISDLIVCNLSNAVIILRLYLFPSNESKSTPSLLASEGSWQRGRYFCSRCLFHPVLSVHFERLFSSPTLLPLYVAHERPTAQLALVWYLIKPSRLRHEGECCLVRDRCGLCANPERVRWGYHLQGERKRSGWPSPTLVCCNESNAAAKWGRLIKLLGVRRKQTQATNSYNQTQPVWVSAFLWINTINTRGKTVNKKNKKKRSQTLNICARLWCQTALIAVEQVESVL